MWIIMNSRYNTNSILLDPNVTQTQGRNGGFSRFRISVSTTGIFEISWIRWESGSTMGIPRGLYCSISTRNKDTSTASNWIKCWLWRIENCNNELYKGCNTTQLFKSQTISCVRSKVFFKRCVWIFSFLVNSIFGCPFQ